MNAHTLHATSIVDRIVNGWLGAPSVKVVQRTTDLPANGVPEDVRGMYRSGETWIDAETQSASTVPDTLAHEALGHHSMRELLGANWRPFMSAVIDGAARGDWRLQCFRDEIQSTYTDDKGCCNLSRVGVADEITAAIVESRFDGNAGRMKIARPGIKLLEAAKGHLAREALYLNRPASFEELEGTILAAEHRLRFGGAFWGVGFRLKRWYASAMAKPWNPNKAPMSLAESERLLKAEKYRRDSWEEWKGMAHLVLIFILVGFILFGVGSFLIDLFTGFRH